MKTAACVLFAASALAACGGGAAFLAPPAAPQVQPALIASPPGVALDLYAGNPAQFVTIRRSGGGDLGNVTLSATTLSFFSAAIQSATPTSVTLAFQLYGGGSSIVTVRDAAGESVNIPVAGIPCGRPDLTNYAALILPSNGARNVAVTTAAYYIEVGSMTGTAQGPFEPGLHAHVVVDNAATVDPLATLSPATPPPNAVTPSPAPPSNYSVGYERGTMPQLAPGHTYALYVYDDTCESPWNAGSFST
ncbi:MAG TPA: hypothetical protein VJP85_10065 [Candidatus Baltobacteraceae bacterium]|nr:hypothetical protein [Candidatus Baltobacteraceae bacterium]